LKRKEAERKIVPVLKEAQRNEDGSPTHS